MGVRFQLFLIMGVRFQLFFGPLKKPCFEGAVSRDGAYGRLYDT